MSAPAVESGKHGAPNAGGAKQQVKSTNGGKSADTARKQAGSPVDAQSKKQQSAPPRAWQGPHPILTRRPSPNTSNGTDRNPVKSSAQPPSKSAASAQSRQPPLSFLLAHFTGLDAAITLRGGEQFSGVFSGASFEGSKTVWVLKMVKRTKLASLQSTNGETSRLNTFIGEGEDYTMTFNANDTVDLNVANVSLASTTAPNGSATSSFRTDTEISGRSDRPRERELQRWEPAGASSFDLSLEDSGSAGWDQFATNERMYGVQSTYDENIYTTAIDRSDPRYKSREARAVQLAREIEGSAPADAHVAEERRQDAELGDGFDEEEKYSGVRREAAMLPKRGANSYIPPSQRPISNVPSVQGAPFDPAIISLAKPTASPAPEQLEGSKSQEDTSSAAPKDAPPPVKKDNTTEDHVRSTADAFRQFANFEKLRVRQAQEAKRSTQRHEKNVKLNDLKKFAANFKLNSRVPDDLVPILAKDREKQVEIQRKAEDAAKEDEVRKREKEREKAAGVSSSPSPALSTAASQASTTPSADPRAAGSTTQNRSRQAQPVRPPVLPGQTQPARTGISQRNQMYRGGIPPPQPLPADLRMPTGPSGAPALSPTAAPRLNVNAFEFRPSANNFTPSGPSPSPRRKPSEASVAPPAFFSADQVPSESKTLKDLVSDFDIIKRMINAEVPEEQKKAMAANGGLPLPYRTPPTWPVDNANANLSYKDAFPKVQLPNQGPSPLHTPGANGPMPHAHQLPSHLQGSQLGGISQRPVYFNPQQHHGQPFDPRMQQFGPNGSVQNSPRFPPAQMAFNGQMPPQMGMQQYSGQPMPSYGMSPSMQYRQLPVQQGGGPMMMMPGQQPNQMQQMRGPGYGQGPQYGGMQMGGHMMTHNPSGGYMNGPMPQQQPYSPMPPHNQPHMPHMQQGFGGSPRPPMMQHSGSHQGYQPQMHLQQQAPYAPSPSHQQGYHLAHSGRQMSSGHFPQMTPRQQAAIPQHPSPGMANATQGDEGK